MNFKMKARMGKLLATAMLLLAGTVLHAQTSPSYTAIVNSMQGATSLATATLDFTNTNKTVGGTLLKEKNRSAKLYLKLDLGNDYVKQNSQWNFRVVMDLTYKFNGSPAIAKTLTVTNTSPEMLKVDDVLSYFGALSPTLTVVVNNLVINDGSASPAALTGFIQNYVNANLRLTATLQREYDVDVRYQSNGLMSNAPTALPVSISNRLVTFSWQPNGVTAYPNYEVQILKLYNTDTTLKSNQNQMSTLVDWTKALKVETQSHKTSIKLTMAEGTGYYLWRVRPVGTYYTGSIANSENYGEWSYAFPDGSSSPLNKTTLITNNPWPFAFYFSDPDEKINWIYSRVFTEGDNFDKSTPTGVKTSEGMNYADGLLNVRQSQKYNSSENTNLVSQTVHDYVGRPALATMPVPVDGGLTGYKLGFVKNTSGTLYTAAMFDDDAKLNNPDQVQSTSGTPFSYYSNNPTSPVDNSNVANAEGYPYKRTLYKNDGTNRVEEESGVGFAHSLGTQANGQGRTTRISYTTPTDDELIRIFGEEAPLANSVIKTVTIDQNNVQSITYTSKEGKTIATALTSTNSANLLPLNNPGSVVSVTNSITENVSNGNKLVSSKRVAITSNGTVVKLSYVAPTLGAGSGCPTGDCNFKLRFYMIDLKQNKTYISDADNQAGITDFATNNAFASGWRLVCYDPVSPATITPTGSNQITLNSGEYIFIKEVFSGNSDYYADSLVDGVNDKIKPLLDAIAARMQAAQSGGSYSDFTQFMQNFTATLQAYATNAITSGNVLTFLCIDPLSLPAGYVVPPASEFSVSPLASSPTDPSSNNLQVVTGCCGTLSVPIPKPTICVACAGSPSSQYTATAMSAMKLANDQAPADSITPYGIEDFKTSSGWAGATPATKRAAIYSLVYREYILPLKIKLKEENFDSTLAGDLWKYAAGFNYHSLNFMISNMLISQYYAGKSIKHTDGNWYKATEVNGGYLLDSTVSSLNKPYNYDCKDVWEAWSNAVELINSFDASGDDNVVSGYNNDQGPNAGQDNADDDDNWDIKCTLLKNYLTRKLGKEVDDFGNSDDANVSGAQKQALTNLVSTFLDNAGYQFAAVVDGASLPTHVSTGGGSVPDDYTQFGEVPMGSGFYTDATVGAITHNNVPYLFDVDNNGNVNLQQYTCNSNTFHELYYPYILRPEWMFKYYVYNVYENNQPGTFIKDTSVLLPHQVVIDIERGYNEPISYLSASVVSNNGLSSSNLCKTLPSTTYTLNGTQYPMSIYNHINWSIPERVNFYKAIKGAPRCYANKGLTVGSTLYDGSQQPPDCAPKSDLIQQAKDILNSYITNLPDKTGEIKSALMNELASSCYTVVSCKTANVTGLLSEAEVDLMVAAVLDNTATQINNIIGKFNNINMPPSNLTPCNSPTNITNTYTNLMCDLPACSQVDCKEIVLYKDNTLDVTSSRKFNVTYFADCDQKVLDMIATGSFMPYIPPLPNCNKDPKVWQDAACLPETGCGPDYAEKTTCPPSNFIKYSKTYSITATGN